MTREFKITPDMFEANNIEAMAEAFNPVVMHGGPYHVDPELDLVEAALLWAAGRGTKADFMSALVSAEFLLEIPS